MVKTVKKMKKMKKKNKKEFKKPKSLFFKFYDLFFTSVGSNYIYNIDF